MTRKTALITGATRGIGRACALQLAREGFDIGFCYRSAEEEAESLSREVVALDARVFSAKVDVADGAAAEHFVKELSAALGDVEVLVNNAGVVVDRPLVTMEPEEWQHVMNTNLGGTFNFTRKVVFGMMKQKRGSIINMTSVAGVFGNPGQTNYSASKAGIIGFTKSLAKEVGVYGIRVNAVAPGYIETDMTKDLGRKVVERVMPNIPLRRMGSSEEVANMVSFLASDRAAYVTAQVIHVDGGIMI